MAKVKIITPVHIGDGEKIEAPCFHRINGQVNRYRFTDLFEQLPVSKLTDSEFLNRLQKNSSSRSDLYSVFNQIDYTKIQPLYSVFYEWDGIASNRDVASQAKSCEKPYIPGSTLKGAIENAFNYALLLQFYKKKKDQIEVFLNSNPRITEGYMLKMLFGDPCDKADSFMKEFYSCLSCADIYFDQIEVNDAKRWNIYKKNSNKIPLEAPECIMAGQESTINNLVQFDTVKIKQLKEDDNFPQEYRRILSFLKIPNIAKACNWYIKDILKIEQSEDLHRFYWDFEPINHSIQEIKTLIASCQPNQFYLRVGMHTNYFAKTVSVFFKEKMPEIYQDKFNDLFAPAKKRGRKSSDAENMPVTRTILFNEREGNMLAGFIKVEL
ncbi:CRISPR type III-a/mtube-associated ramp protein csm5 [Firmicutes bacterium M10-2]|nr:CRISPR type III-a/mtube-associated ramp protein csm5 [Firmicutes bacterium M10-2]